MLQRPDDRRERRRQQQRRHRQRLAQGKRCYPIELGGEHLDFLIRTGWLDGAAAESDREVSRAVQALLTDTAKRV
jgi:hypothetical protein